MKEFLVRRWVRLFPAMLAATLLILGISAIIPHYPFAHGLLDILPGLTFTDHWIWAKILNHKVESLDSAFWTLYVEVQFYVLAAVIFYQLRRWTLPVMIAFSAALSIAVQCPGEFSEKLSALTGLLSLCLPWFCVGMAVYKIFKNRQLREKALWIAGQEESPPSFSKAFSEGYLGSGFDSAMLICSIALVCLRLEPTASISKLLLIFLFISPFFIKSAARMFSRPWIVLVGTVSYPLYLIHQQLGVGILNALKNIELGGGETSDPIMILITMIAVSWIIVKFIEAPMQKWMKIQLKGLMKTEEETTPHTQIEESFAPSFATPTPAVLREPSPEFAPRE